MPNPRRKADHLWWVIAACLRDDFNMSHSQISRAMNVPMGSLSYALSANYRQKRLTIKAGRCPVSYRDLLLSYIEHVYREEGFTYLEPHVDLPNHLNEDQAAMLRSLGTLVRETVSR